MIRSMLAAVTGMRNHQQFMDVVGNNIANVSTIGFKGSNAVFQDVLSQSLGAAGAPTALNGGTNPRQIGLGSQLAAIPLNMAQGTLQRTGRDTDIAIEGDGMFIVRSNGQTLYTRAGALSLDANGNVVTPDGGILQGWAADGTGAINTNAPVGGLRIPVGSIIPPSATARVELGGRLSTSATGTITNGVVVYDDQGTAHQLTVSYTKTGANAWTIDVTDGQTPPTVYASQALTFSAANGQPSLGTFTVPAASLPGTWANPITMDLGLGNPDGLVQFGGTTTAQVLFQDGAPSGELKSFAVAADGTISGVFSNGQSRALGQIAVAMFNNPQGLAKTGGSYFRETENSGLPQIGIPNQAGRGMISSATLEGSNVDLAQEFTNLIQAQRGFQANARVISASDETLQEIVNLKR